MNAINLSNINFQKLPFAHFSSKAAFQNKTTIDLLEWFKNEAPWEYVETEFYQQYEFSLMDFPLPSKLSILTSDKTIHNVQKIMMNEFDVIHIEIVEITAHKLIKGQSIRIHNDCIGNAETHRLIIQINSGWSDENGGLFVLFNSSNSEDICKVIKPLHNSAIGFAISENSNHAVSKVYGSDRYSLIYTCREVA